MDKSSEKNTDKNSDFCGIDNNNDNMKKILHDGSPVIENPDSTEPQLNTFDENLNESSADSVENCAASSSDFEKDENVPITDIKTITAINNEHKKFTFKNKLYEKKYLALCFFVPLCVMMLIYVAIGVWPISNGSVLVLDLNAQYVYYFEKLRSIICEGGSLLYTFQRALGGEFMGIFAYYLSSPFSLIVALFPKEYITEALLTILLLKCGLCGLTFGIYIHQTRGRHPAATLIFSSMYALSAFAVVMQHNIMWTDNIICLPLILLGIERIIKYRKYKTFIIFLSLAIFSNFYIGYMTCLFVAVYFFIRYFTYYPNERNILNERAHFLKSLLRILICSLIAVMIAAAVILPAYYSLSFGKLEFSDPNYKPKQMFDFINLLSKVFFGSYDTVRPEGMPFLYCGMLMPLLLPLYFIASGISARKKVGAGLLLVLFAVSFNFNIFDIIWHGFQRPNWLNARFAFMFVFIALILAYDAFIRIREIGYKKVVACASGVIALLLVLQALDLENLPDFMAVWASLGFIGVYLVALYFTDSARDKSFSIPGIVLSVLVCAELLLSGIANAYCLDDDVVYSKRTSYREFIDPYLTAVKTIDDDGFYRSEKLEHRKTNDNLALGINGLSNSTSTLNQKVITLLKRFGFTSKSHWSKYIGSTVMSDIFFGIKYIYADKNKSELPYHLVNYYDKVSETEDGIIVYKNPFALSLAFSMSDNFKNFELTDDSYSDPFDLMNKLFSLMSESEEYKNIFEPAEIESMDYSGCKTLGVVDHDGYEKYDSSGTAKISFTITAKTDDILYMYIPSDYPRDAELYVNGRSLGKYFTNDTHSIVELGFFETGERAQIELSLEEDKIYLGEKGHYFYTFNEDNFNSFINGLDNTQLNITSHKEDRITGNMSVKEGMTEILTTIPYDEGWVITANGHKIEYKSALDSLIAFTLDEGEYEIEMKYRPDCVKYGTIISSAGALLFGGVCFHDYSKKRKNNRILLKNK